MPPVLERASVLASDRKGVDMLVMDLRGISNATDYFLVVSGTSDMHVRSIAEHVIEELKKEGHRPSHVEGLRTGRWVLIDYIDFVVHVFHPAAREFYQLERLWIQPAGDVEIDFGTGIEPNDGFDPIAGIGGDERFACA